MKRRWKLKTNSSHILLVLITLILVKAEWVGGQSPEVAAAEGDSGQQTHVYIGHDQIAHYYFGSGNDSFALEGVRQCLDSFQLITCVKMLLLSRIDDVAGLLDDSAALRRDLHVLNGMLTLKLKNATTTSVPSQPDDSSTLDEEIAVKLRNIFRRRSLLVNLLPKTKIEIEPSPESPKDGLLCFRYAIHHETESATVDEAEGRKKKKGGMPMMMIVPPLIMLGLMPFTLASLKAMVMNAVMINMMALNGAIFMTIRNLVFGPRKGDNVKYVNYGYSKDRQTQSKRPVLIIHSPAAFVKQPSLHTHHHPPAPHFPSEGPSPPHQLITTAGHFHEDHHHVLHGSNAYQERKDQHGRIERPILRRTEPSFGGGFNPAFSQTPSQRFSGRRPRVKRSQKNHGQPHPARSPTSYQTSGTLQ